MYRLSPSLLLIGVLTSVSCTTDKSVDDGQIDDTNSTGTPSETDLDGDGLSNEEDIDAEIDEGCVEDLKKLGKRTASAASALEESELAWALRPDTAPEGEQKKRRR